MHRLGGAYTLILHPQYIGRPSRLQMLQDLVDYMRTFPGVWFTHGAELARYVASEAAGAGTDGRPIAEGESVTRVRAGGRATRGRSSARRARPRR